LIVCGRADRIEIKRIIKLDQDGVAITHVASSNKGHKLGLYEDRYQYLPGKPDFVWSQNIKHRPDALIPHWQFKSPAVIYQTGPILAAIIPELQVLNAATLTRQPTALDLTNPQDGTTRFSYGVTPSVLTYHCIYHRDTNTYLDWKDWPLTLVYRLFFSGQEPDRLGYRRIVHHLWKTYGRPDFLASPDIQTNHKRCKDDFPIHIGKELLPQGTLSEYARLDLFDTWSENTWRNYAQEKYFEFDYDGQRCSALRSDRAGFRGGTGNDAWFNS